MTALLLALVLTSQGQGRAGDELIAAQVRALEVDPQVASSRGELSLVLLEPPDRALPLEIRIDASALELDENRLDWSAVVDPLALTPRVRAWFRAPSEPGRHHIRASVSYYVCDEQWCRRKHGEVHWTVVVRDQSSD